MNNQQIINQRWKKAENLFRSKLPEIRALYDEIGDDAIDTINSLGITHENLNRIVPENTRRQVKRKIESWKEEGIVTGYFAFMIASLTRYTYAKVFEILLYGYYFSKARQINSISNYIFRETVQDCYDQGNRDLNQESKKLKWAVILPLLMISDYNMSYENYLIALSQTSAQETYRRIIELLKMKAKIVLSDLKQLLLKQVNRILNINKGKYSGAIVDVSRQAGNKGYIMPAEEKDHLVRFVAEMDDRTTEMCRSLDGQIFHTKAWNRFTRYSDFYKGLHTFSWFGLEQGLNLPPINDHFHWCRSVVTYQVELPLGKNDSSFDGYSNGVILGKINMDKLDAYIEYFKQQIRDSKNEKCIVIQKDGTVVFSQGDANNVFPQGNIDEAVIIHNHPKEYEDEIAGSFGENDMEYANENNTFAKLIAVDEKYDYLLSLRNGYSFNAYKEAYRTCDYMLDEDFKHCVMMRLKEMGAIDYERREK